MSEFKSYRVWDKTTRWFHWINALCVIGLAGVGFVILNADGLGIPDSGKITLKTVHASIGYVLVLNLLWRIVWAFIGNPFARWKAILPGGRGYLADLRSYIAAFFTGHPKQYLGHNPVGRLAVGLMLVLLLTMALTGLFLAGSDLFLPPLGGVIAQWVAAPGVDPATLVPYAPEMYDATAYQEMRDLRAPIITIHLFGFYTLMVVVILHVVGVIVTELKEGGSLISAMFTGRKLMRGQPEDKAPGDEAG